MVHRSLSSRQHPYPVSRRRQRGMSLLEVVIVLALLVVMLMIATASYQSAIRDRRMTRAAEDMLQVIRYAQQQAVGDIDGCYQAVMERFRARVERHNRSEDLTCVYGSPVIKMTDDFEIGVEASPFDVKVMFTGSGRLASGAAHTVTLVSGGQSRTISIDASTGRAHIN